MWGRNTAAQAARRGGRAAFTSAYRQPRDPRLRGRPEDERASSATACTSTPPPCRRAIQGFLRPATWPIGGTTARCWIWPTCPWAKRLPQRLGTLDLSSAAGGTTCYYSVGEQDTSRIGVAVGDAPTGQLRRLGPAPARATPPADPAGQSRGDRPDGLPRPPVGQDVPVRRGSRGATLRVLRELRQTPTSTGVRPGGGRGDARTQFTERRVHARIAPAATYLTYSHGNYRDDSYSVHYATGDSPTGPWQYLMKPNPAAGNGEAQGRRATPRSSRTRRRAGGTSCTTAGTDRPRTPARTAAAGDTAIDRVTYTSCRRADRCYGRDDQQNDWCGGRPRGR